MRASATIKSKPQRPQTRDREVTVLAILAPRGGRGARKARVHA